MPKHPLRIFFVFDNKKLFLFFVVKTQCFQKIYFKFICQICFILLILFKIIIKKYVKILKIKY